MSKIEVTLLPESRRSAAKPRASTMLRVGCTDEAGRISVIRVRNLSETGLGGEIIEGDPPLKEQDVVLTLKSGTRIHGRIVWLGIPKIGIAFDLPFNMEQLGRIWKGPSFEVSALHANIDNNYRRPGLKLI